MPRSRPTSPSGVCTCKRVLRATPRSQRSLRSVSPTTSEWPTELGLPRANRPAGPFKMKEYVPPGTTEAAAADQRADSRFADALVYNERGDNYALLTVLFALVLFFAAASTRLVRSNAQWILLGVAIIFLIAATVILATFPILV